MEKEIGFAQVEKIIMKKQFVRKNLKKERFCMRKTRFGCPS